MARLDAAVSAELRAAAVEHAMRLTDDEALVHIWRRVAIGSAAARAALGRLLWDPAARALPGTPLAVVAFGAPSGPHAIDPTWRTGVPPVRASMWAHLAVLRALDHDVCTAVCGDIPDAIAQLQHLLGRAAPVD
jgi:hypothetical protein